jgi:hypothetical protein
VQMWPHLQGGATGSCHLLDLLSKRASDTARVG